MQFTALGKSNIQISRIIMGTWQAGKTMWTGIDDTETTEAMRAAFDAGITTFDTASAYGNGHSEQILGRALKKVRDRVVIATKVFAHSLSHEKVIKACHKSLKDLGTDYIDLYQIHWPAGSFGSKKVPIQETMGALNQLKEQGKIRAIGVSNFSREQIEEASRYGRIDSHQPPYSLFWRHEETDTIPHCTRVGMTVLAYSPLAQGILTGKFGSDHVFEKGDNRTKNRLFEPDHYSRVQEALSRLGPVAERNGITMAQLALAWVISHPGICAIAGARNAAQSVQNAQAGKIVLSEEDLSEMNTIGRTVSDHLYDHPVM